MLGDGPGPDTGGEQLGDLPLPRREVLDERASTVDLRGRTRRRLETGQADLRPRRLAAGVEFGQPLHEAAELASPRGRCSSLRGASASWIESSRVGRSNGLVR